MKTIALLIVIFLSTNHVFSQTDSGVTISVHSQIIYQDAQSFFKDNDLGIPKDTVKAEAQIHVYTFTKNHKDIGRITYFRYLPSCGSNFYLVLMPTRDLAFRIKEYQKKEDIYAFRSAQWLNIETNSIKLEFTFAEGNTLSVPITFK